MKHERLAIIIYQRQEIDDKSIIGITHESTTRQTFPNAILNTLGYCVSDMFRKRKPFTFN